MRPTLWFALWAAAGAGVVLGVLTVLSIGVYVLAGTAALGALLGWRGDRRLAGPGLLAGLGMVPLYVGYLNRGGPGTVCVTTAASQACTDEWSPWPWLAAGIALTGASAWLALRRRSGRCRTRTAGNWRHSGSAARSGRPSPSPRQ